MQLAKIQHVQIAEAPLYYQLVVNYSQPFFFLNSIMIKCFIFYIKIFPIRYTDAKYLRLSFVVQVQY